MPPNPRTLTPPSKHPSRLRDTIRIAILVALAAGPLAFGAVHERAFVPILAIFYVAGGLSWARAHWARAHGHAVEELPARRLVAAFLLLVVFQLVPLPPGLLAWLSPGSHELYAGEAGVLSDWRPITVSRALTLRGLAFLVGFSLLFGTMSREFDDSRWRLRLVLTLALTGTFITLVGLVQQASLDPGNIYGLWRPQYDYAVFGPYVNKNHYAGFMAMAVPLAIGLVADAFDRLSRSWRSRRVGWLALGESSGTRFLRHAAMAMFLIVGVLLCESRGGLVALGAGLGAMGLRAGYRRRWLISGGVLLVLLASTWVDFDRWTTHFQRSFNDSRGKLWVDQSSLVPDFPLFGVGFNALGPAYRPRQTVNVENFFDQAHNEYLQVLLDTGLFGILIFLPFFARLLAAAWRAAVLNPIQLGIWGALAGAAASNVFDFNWQIPANAAAFVALAGVAGRQARSP